MIGNKEISVKFIRIFTLAMMVLPLYTTSLSAIDEGEHERSEVNLYERNKRTLRWQRWETQHHQHYPGQNQSTAPSNHDYYQRYHHYQPSRWGAGEAEPIDPE